MKIGKFTCALLIKSCIQGCPLLIGICGVIRPDLPVNIFSLPPAKYVMLNQDLLSYLGKRSSSFQIWLIWVFYNGITFSANLSTWAIMLKSIIIICNQTIVSCVSLSVSISGFHRYIFLLIEIINYPR